MKSGTYSRIVVMVAALAAVLWLIRSLNTNAVEKAFENLGLQAGGAAAPGRPLRPGEELLQLCPTRIVSFVWNQQVAASRKAIEERGQPGGIKAQWWAVDSAGAREVAAPEIETWLAGHCQAAVRPIEEKDVAAISARRPLEIRYIDGSSLSVDEISRQYFRIGARYYESADLADALKELRVTARFEPPEIHVPVKLAPAAPAPVGGENQHKAR